MPRLGDCSHHARVRMQQRGISEQALNLLLRYGRTAYHQPRRTLVYMDHGARRAALRDCGRAAGPLIDRVLRFYAVVGADGVLVSVCPRNKRMWHK